MRITELIKLLENELEVIGEDVEVTMQATLLPDGYSRSKDGLSDVFESTVEQAIQYDNGIHGKRLRLFWQT